MCGSLLCLSLKSDGADPFGDILYIMFRAISI